MFSLVYRKFRKIISRQHIVWKTKPEDIYVVSYPRSGNTWVRYLLANLLEPEFDWNITNINRVVPDIHENMPDDWIERQPRLIKSHELFNPFCRKAIYIYRDGRDVAVSYYHYLSKIKNFRGNFNEFFELYIRGRVPFGSWGNHITQWLLRSNSINLLPIQYEMLLGNTAREVTRIGDFLDMSWTSTKITTAVEKSSFEKIQNDYALYKRESHWNKGFHAGVKGNSGKWKEVLNQQQNEQFWETSGEVAFHLGYRK